MDDAVTSSAVQAAGLDSPPAGWTALDVLPSGDDRLIDGLLDDGSICEAEYWEDVPAELGGGSGGWAFNGTPLAEWGFDRELVAWRYSTDKHHALTEADLPR